MSEPREWPPLTAPEGCWGDRITGKCGLHNAPYIYGEGIDSRICAVAWIARAEKAEAAIARVRALHRPCADPDLHDGAHCCPECSDFGRSSIFRPWPCETIRALGGDA